jgi:prevent-host-death family protein
LTFCFVDGIIVTDMVTNVSQLKAHLSSRLKLVQSGETILVTDHNRNIARIVPVENSSLVEKQAVRSFVPVRPVLTGLTPLSGLKLLDEERGEH